MPAIEPLCQLIGINTNYFSKKEILVLEIEIFFHVCKEIKDIIKIKNDTYFRLMKLSLDREEAVLDASLMRHVINDILLSDEYSLEGIAFYTQMPEEVISDIAEGINLAPSLSLSRKLIELHRFVRPNFYREIIKKIISKYISEG